MEEKWWDNVSIPSAQSLERQKCKLWPEDGARAGHVVTWMKGFILVNMEVFKDLKGTLLHSLWDAIAEWSFQGDIHWGVLSCSEVESKTCWWGLLTDLGILVVRIFFYNNECLQYNNLELLLEWRTNSTISFQTTTHLHSNSCIGFSAITQFS